MKTAILLTILLITFGSCQNEYSKTELAVDHHPATDVHSDWKLAVQMWTFNKYTFLEGLEKTAELGISWIEAYAGQRLSPDHGDVCFDHSMSVEHRELAKKWLRERGLHLINYGVVKLPNDENESRRVFEFARKMGIQNIASEPDIEAMDLVEKLAIEYQINVAIHNHPKPSKYWNPETVLKTLANRSELIGTCADIGHWARSAVNVIDALQLLEGKIKYLHFKDLNEFGERKAHDVPWGTGINDIAAVLNELKRQNFEGVFSIEYEHNWTSSLPEIKQCVQFFSEQSAELFDPQWKPILKNDLSNCIFEPGSWIYENGILSAVNGGDIWTGERYGNFILDLEFNLDTLTNSGVFLRTGDLDNWLHTAIEVQVLDSFGKDSVNKHDCGAIFDCLEPNVNAVKAPGEWNRYSITCLDNRIYVVLNGQQVIDMDLNLWTEAHKNPDGTSNKFNNAYKDMPKEGHIGLQYHGHPIWYRNIKIKEL